MSLYIDASVLLELCFEEPDSDRAEEILASDEEWITGRHASIEIRRHLAWELDG